MRYFIAENWWSPSVTMMQKSVSPKKFANIISAFQFFITFGGCASTLLFGLFVNMLDCSDNPAAIGYLLAAFNLLGYIGSIVSWNEAGKNFEEQMIQ